jgi:predicted amidohydrolase
MNNETDRVHVSLLQINTTPGGRTINIAKPLELIGETARKRPGIVVLPEVWSGGFDYPEIKDLSLQTPKILKDLRSISKSYKSIIIGSLPERVAGKLYNTAAIIGHGRIIGRYRKQRLFSPMNEDQHFETCRTRKVFSTSAGKIGIAICFDLRFLELFSGLRKSRAWLLIVPAQWPEPRCAHWEALLVARAIENQIYVAGCNRIGQNRGTRFCGNSMIVDPWGKVIARGGKKAEVVSARVNPLKVQEVRNRIPMG